LSPPPNPRALLPQNSRGKRKSAAPPKKKAYVFTHAHTCTVKLKKGTVTYKAIISLSPFQHLKTGNKNRDPCHFEQRSHCQTVLIARYPCSTPLDAVLHHNRCTREKG